MFLDQGIFALLEDFNLLIQLIDGLLLRIDWKLLLGGTLSMRINALASLAHIRIEVHWCIIVTDGVSSHTCLFSLHHSELLLQCGIWVDDFLDCISFALQIFNQVIVLLFEKPQLIHQLWYLLVMIALFILCQLVALHALHFLKWHIFLS